MLASQCFDSHVANITLVCDSATEQMVESKNDIKIYVCSYFVHDGTNYFARAGRCSFLFFGNNKGLDPLASWRGGR